MAERRVEETGSSSPPLGLIPITHWKVPETSVSRSVKDAFQQYLAQLRVGAKQADQACENLDDLPELSRSGLQTLAPAPDYASVAQEISNAFDALWSEEGGQRDIRFLVAPPFWGVRSALACFPELEPVSGGESGAWTLITPPENLLLDDQSARDWWDQQDLSRPWVIAELGDFWLRHLSGLSLIRELLRRIAAGGLAPGIVGCSSWCWQFWSSYIEDVHFSPLTPEPMDAVSLGSWFENLAASGGQAPVSARMANDGADVLPVSEPSQGKKNKRNGFLRELAAVARGNPGVALAIWRRALRSRPEEQADSGEPGQTASAEPRASRVWVVPFDQLRLPAVPQTQGDKIGLVLHALLLHDGLDDSGLALVTGIPEYELGFVLTRLARSELIGRGQSGGCWQVLASGYPSVRRHLQSWGFPVDPF
ncbi:hypothetical protein [Marinobacter sp. F3R08]|uniref:hypothetical protein n=1 Tax=Marinobacter sp. F3R08 TaxID=2841559 RepID=UPI001E40D824|nr:hypothetical protein [Marinobacter sp. F3R08]